MIPKDDYIINFLLLLKKFIKKYKDNEEYYQNKNKILKKNKGIWYLLKEDKLYQDNNLYNLIINNLTKEEIKDLELDTFASIKNKDLYFPFE